MVRITSRSLMKSTGEGPTLQEKPHSLDVASKAASYTEAFGKLFPTSCS